MQSPQQQVKRMIKTLSFPKQAHAGEGGLSMDLERLVGGGADYGVNPPVWL